jgi:phage-related protein
MSDVKLRTIVLYEHYFSKFYGRQRQKVKDKIVTQHHIPSDYLKHVEGTEGLYEIRVQQGSDIFRIFCFFDDDKLVVLANGFQKKTQKTPMVEIERALRIKKAYEQEKEYKNT